MKLNPDCIRDVLLYLEENLKVKDCQKFSEITLSQLQDALSQYQPEDVFYSVYNLHEIHFIDGRFSDINDMKMYFCEINNITWNGHQFLNTIRPKTVWEATKQGASKLGIMSMHALNTIAMKITEAVITNPVVIDNIIKHMDDISKAL